LLHKPKTSYILKRREYSSTKWKKEQIPTNLDGSDKESSVLGSQNAPSRNASPSPLLHYLQKSKLGWKKESQPSIQINPTVQIDLFSLPQ
jgi:hypothetical protein